MKKTITLSSRTKSEVLLSIDDTSWGALLRKVPLSLLGRDEGDLEIDNDQFEELVASIEKLAWGRLLRYLAKRERSRRECWRYFDRTAVHPAVRNRLLDRAEELRYLDDTRFAKLFVQELQRKGKSRRAAEADLRQRGVDEITAAEALREHFDTEAEADAVRRAAEKALRRTGGKPRQERREKALASLARKGFSYSDARVAIDELLHD